MAGNERRTGGRAIGRKEGRMLVKKSNLPRHLSFLPIAVGVMRLVLLWYCS